MLGADGPGQPDPARPPVEAAQAADRTKATHLGTRYRRAAPTKGAKRAAVTAHPPAATAGARHHDFKWAAIAALTDATQQGPGQGRRRHPVDPAHRCRDACRVAAQADRFRREHERCHPEQVADVSMS